ncbi:GntR family transcriptional regulator [Roseivivax marinus]|uniref:GntR family transcriptional regulator n=1 Tax=Roseivivax marinus TaxID=1379903 RepID=UPI00273EE0E0|nr:GntR family transcriptional regulator [Roseivivax marinus]
MAARPMYAELADEIRRGIQDGTWKPGDLLPTELDLAAERGLSRSTVRAALTRLVDLGLIRRQQGVGTRVCAPRGDEGYDASIASMEELIHFGLATQRIVRGRSEEVVDEATARWLEIRPGTRWIRLETVRASLETGDPICRTEIFFDPHYGAALQGLEDHHGLITELLRNATGIEIDAVEQIIRPVTLDEPSSELLCATPGQPALEIVRRYLSAGRTIYITVSKHPADRFDYRMTLRRQKQMS